MWAALAICAQGVEVITEQTSPGAGSSIAAASQIARAVGVWNPPAQQLVTWSAAVWHAARVLATVQGSTHFSWVASQT
jgi:hypothetical protein